MPAPEGLGELGQPGGLFSARELPVTTKLPMERANPLLSCAMGKWLKAHGKTVKPKLSDEQRDSLQKCFRIMDADGSGAIDAEELDAAFKLLGLSVSRREIEAMLAEVDRDGSGEVEYAEFLEIMTLQLTRLAEQQQQQQGKDKGGGKAGGGGGRGGPPSRSGSGGRQQRQQQGAAEGEAEGGGSGGSSGRSSSSGGSAAAGGGGVSAASVLPFDLVATAYRRKKLMEALEEDDKEFVLSVAAAEEEERLQAEAEAEAEAAAAAGRRSRRGSAMPPQAGGMRRLSTAASGADGRASPARGSASGAKLPSHASFLDSLSKEERRIIEALSRKYRDEQDEMAALAAAHQHQRRGGRQQGAPASPPFGAWHAGQVAAAAGGGAAAAGAGQQHPAGQHMAALQREVAGAHPGRWMRGGGAASPPALRPASAAVVQRRDFRVAYQLGKAATGAASSAPPAGVLAAEGSRPGPAEGGTEGVLLSPPLFSAAMFAGS